jgi:hypothetical protein
VALSPSVKRDDVAAVTPQQGLARGQELARSK